MSKPRQFNWAGPGGPPVFAGADFFYMPRVHADRLQGLSPRKGDVVLFNLNGHIASATITGDWEDGQWLMAHCIRWPADVPAVRFQNQERERRLAGLA